MTHTPEPWMLGADLSIICVGWRDCDGNISKDSFGKNGWAKTVAKVCSQSWCVGDEDWANAARIVSCVNGCAGLNPEAFRDVVEALDVIVGFAGFNLENIEAGYAALAKARAV